jgi:hypothetical protein
MSIAQHYVSNLEFCWFSCRIVRLSDISVQYTVQRFEIFQIACKRSNIGETGRRIVDMVRRVAAMNMGLNPQISLSAAGLRTDPMESVPKATSVMPVLTATALPVLEPPGYAPGIAGYTVSTSVNPNPNGGVFCVAYSL